MVFVSVVIPRLFFLRFGVYSIRSMEIDLVFFCEHHMLTVDAVLVVRYCSKINLDTQIMNVVRIVSEGLGIQEVVTSNIQKALFLFLGHDEFSIEIKATHGCMMQNYGVDSRGLSMVTSSGECNNGY